MWKNEYNLEDIIICYMVLPQRTEDTDEWVMNMIQKFTECE